MANPYCLLALANLLFGAAMGWMGFPLTALASLFYAFFWAAQAATEGEKHV